MMRLSRNSKSFLILIAFTFGLSVLYFIQFFGRNSVIELNDNNNNNNNKVHSAPTATELSLLINWRNLTEDQVSRMSTLGRWLTSPESTGLPKPRDANRSEEYLILIWKHGPMLERRHLKHFTNETFSPWDNCSVKNCRLSYESGDAEEADAILFHLHRTRGPNDLPKNLNFENRMRQRWVFLTDESPLHTFLYGQQHLSAYNGLFNWSMTYRRDSDVPVPYGRTLLIENAEESARNSIGHLIKTKTKLVAIMGSNCNTNNHRWDDVRKLKEILGQKLDIYGHCLGGDTESCPGHFTKDCSALGAYKFYLAFENSNCREYLTEKPFWHGYGKYSVPIIFGASKDNCNQLLPPKSYVHVDDFANPNTLADYLLYLDENDAEYLKLHEWRKTFKVLNEHGYFQSDSRHYCRLCEALNYNDPSPKVYDKLEEFWSEEKDCW